MTLNITLFNNIIYETIFELMGGENPRVHHKICSDGNGFSDNNVFKTVPSYVYGSIVKPCSEECEK